MSHNAKVRQAEKNCPGFLLRLWIALFLLGSATVPGAGREYNWEATNGPQGGVVWTLANTPGGAILVGTESGGLFRSSDGGDTWYPVELAWPCCNYSVPALAVADNVIYAGTWGGGVHLSVDDGETWSAAGAIPGEGYPIVSSLAACVFGSRVYAGGNFGVAVSSDQGASWSPLSSGLPSGVWVRGLALRGPVLFARLDDTVYRLDPESQVWASWTDGLPVPPVVQSLCNTADALFVAGHEGGVHHLDCGDSTWVPMNDGLFDDNVDALIDVDGAFYAGLMGGGVFRRDPVSRWWDPVNSGLWNTDIRAMGRHRRSPLAGSYGAGVFLYDPDGQSWEARNEGIHAPGIRGIVVDGTYVYAGSFGAGVGVSPDEGATWQTSVDGLEAVFVNAMAIADGDVYAGTWNGVWKSVDQGQSWSPSGLQGDGVMSLVAPSSTLYAGLYSGGVWSSENGGATWDPLGDGLPASRVQGITVLGSDVYAAVNGFGVYALRTGETAWVPINTDLPETDLWALATHGGTLFVGLGSRGIWRWNGTTESWEATGYDSGSVSSLADLGAEIAAGGWGEFLVSDDGGDTWTNRNSGLRPWLLVSAIGAGGGRVYAGLEGGGVYRTSADVNALPPAPDPSAGAPWTELRAAPNPFGRSSHLSFGLTQQAFVDLAVFDSAGRRVATIVAGRLPAGPHQRIWNGETATGGRAAAGLYLMRLAVDGRELTTKAVRID